MMERAKLKEKNIIYPRELFQIGQLHIEELILEHFSNLESKTSFEKF
jgi:hypothetical protein